MVSNLVLAHKINIDNKVNFKFRGINVCYGPGLLQNYILHPTKQREAQEIVSELSKERRKEVSYPSSLLLQHNNRIYVLSFVIHFWDIHIPKYLHKADSQKKKQTTTTKSISKAIFAKWLL